MNMLVLVQVYSSMDKLLEQNYSTFVWKKLYSFNHSNHQYKFTNLVYFRIRNSLIKKSKRINQKATRGQKLTETKKFNIRL